MKSKIYGALAMLAVALIVSVPFAQAQNGVKADVPFAFSLQDKAMPAGNYQIVWLSDQAFEVRNLDTGRGQLLLKQIAVQATQAKSPRAGLPQVRRPVLPERNLGCADSHYGIAICRVEAGERSEDGGQRSARNRDCRDEVVAAPQQRNPELGELRVSFI